MPDQNKPYQQFLKMWTASDSRPRPPSNVINLAEARRARRQQPCDCPTCRPAQDELKSA